MDTGRSPISIMFPCQRCGSTIMLTSLSWEMGKRFKIPCPVCGSEYHTAVALGLCETPIASAFKRWAEENGDNKNDN